jgi:hypothetical protein
MAAGGGKRFLLTMAVMCAVQMDVAHAEDAPNPCEQFHWPVATEREWFAAPDITVLPAGASVAAFPSTAFIVKLAPAANVTFALPPGRAPKPDAVYAGVISLPAMTEAGIYQVTLSDEAWIDVIQDGQAQKSLEHSGRKDCPEIRKSVRFEIAAKPVTLQLSGVSGDAVKVAIRKVQ